MANAIIMITQNEEIICRNRDSLMLLDSTNNSINFAAPCFAYSVSKSGKKLGISDLYGLRVLYNDLEILRTRNQAKHLIFSECENYLITAEKMTENNPNLLIWDLNSPRIIYSFHQPNFNKDQINFSIKDPFLYYKNNDQLWIFRIPDENPIKVINDIRVSSFSVNGDILCIYGCEVKGNLAYISLFLASDLPDFKATRSLDITKSQLTSFYWNFDHSKLLFCGKTEIDITGRVYSGQNSLYLLQKEYQIRPIPLETGPV